MYKEEGRKKERWTREEREEVTLLSLTQLLHLRLCAVV
jgi:hypothetical protein